MSAKRVAFAASGLAMVTGMKCPGSGAWFGHAKTTVSAVAAASCDKVKAEIVARASSTGGWVDPHNGGHYSVISSSDTEIETQRKTNPSKDAVHLGKVYTDKQIFTLEPNGDSCLISACSESQGTSMKDFSTNYCDIRNLYCGSDTGCKPVSHDLTISEKSTDASSGQSDWGACIVPVIAPAMNFMAVSDTKCPGSGAWFGHAKTQVVATAAASCAAVQAEIVARASGANGWVDPHHGGHYSVISSSSTEIETQRKTNPSHDAVHLGKVYTDKQVFTLAPSGNSCVVSACSESQGTSMKDFSTNYCDIRNLFCGKADGCKPVKTDFTSTETSAKASSGQHDWSACIASAATPIEV